MTTGEIRTHDCIPPRRESPTERIVVGALAVVVLGMGIYLVQDFRAALSDGRFSGNRIAALKGRGAPSAHTNATADATPVE